MTTCSRCGKPLRSPVVIHGQAFGSTCARIVGKERAGKPHQITTSSDDAAFLESRRFESEGTVYAFQQSLFPTRWQRIKARVLEVLSAWRDPFEWSGR